MTVQRRTFRYKRIGACVIGGDGYEPAGTGPHPVIVWIHGGALIGGSRRDIPDFHAARYLEAGFAILAIDYRLAPETKLPDIVSDVSDAFAWARSEGPGAMNIDPGRIAVIGHSAGGYLAHWAATAIRPRPQAVATFYGYGDIVSDWYRTPSRHYLAMGRISESDARSGVGERVISAATGEERWRFYRYTRQTGTWPSEVVGSAVLDDPDGGLSFRPVRRVSAAHPPTILVHGDRDTDVPFSASVEMAEALAATGVEHEVVAVTGRDHGFDGDRSDPEAMRALDRVVAFLGTHLG